MHHAAGQRTGFVDLDRVAAGGPDGRRPTDRSGRRRPPEPACRWAARRRATASFSSAARSPRKRSTAWMLTALSSSPRLQLRLAGVIADPAMHGRQRVVAQERFPGLAVFARPAPDRARPGCFRRPGRRCCKAAGDRHRPAGASRTGPVALFAQQVDDRGEIRFRAVMCDLNAF